MVLLNKAKGIYVGSRKATAVTVGTRKIWPSRTVKEWRLLGGPYAIDDTSNIQNRITFEKEPGKSAVAGFFTRNAAEDIWVMGNGSSEKLQCKSCEDHRTGTRVFLDMAGSLHDYGLSRGKNAYFYKAIWEPEPTT